MKIKYLILIFIVGGLTVGCENSNLGYDREKYELLASAYSQQELYSEAIKTYQEMLGKIDLKTDLQAKINYRIGELYFDRLNDYRGALAAYTAAKALGLPQELEQKMGRKMVVCLENLGRSLDASRTISNNVSLDAAQESHEKTGSIVVAKIGDSEITLSAIESVLGELPQDSSKKNQLVQSFVNTELIARAAKRKGIANKPEIKQKIHAMQNQVLIQASIAEETKKIKIDPADVQTFFQAHKNQFIAEDSTKTFSDVKNQVEQAYMRYKQQSFIQNYTQELRQAEQVQIFENRF